MFLSVSSLKFLLFRSMPSRSLSFLVMFAGLYLKAFPRMLDCGACGPKGLFIYVMSFTLFHVIKPLLLGLGVRIWKLNAYQNVDSAGLIILRDILSHVVIEEGMVMGTRCWVSMMVKQVCQLMTS